MQTQKAPPDPNRPKTLASAIERIKQLTTDPDAKPPGSPKPGNPTGPRSPIQPTGPRPSGPIPIRSGQGLSDIQGLSDMAPKPLGDYLENRSDRELELLLAQETGKNRQHQDSRIVQGIYAEIRKRRKS